MSEVGGEVRVPRPHTGGPRGRRWVVGLLKLGVAAGLIGWIASSGNLDLSKLARPLESPGRVALALGLAGVGLCVSGLRWLVLLRSSSIGLPVWRAVQLTWIGHFWNMVIPGAVSGDAVKMFYIGQVVPERREAAWTTVFADRAIGLVALISISTAAAAANMDLMWGNSELRATFLFMLSLLSASVVGGLVIVAGVGRGWAWVRRLPAAERLGRAYGALRAILRHPAGVTGAYGLSLISHGITITNVYLLGSLALEPGETGLKLSQYLTLLPVAMFSNAIPIAPGGGLGVGEKVLEVLFAGAGGDPAQGVTAMLLLRLTLYAIALPAALVYVLHRRG